MISEKSAYACIRTHASPRGSHQYNSSTSRLPGVHHKIYHRWALCLPWKTLLYHKSLRSRRRFTIDLNSFTHRKPQLCRTGVFLVNQSKSNFFTIGVTNLQCSQDRIRTCIILAINII